MMHVEVNINLSRSGKTQPNSHNHTINLQLDTLMISKIQRALCPPSLCASTLVSTLKALITHFGLNFPRRPEFVRNLTQKSTSICSAVQCGGRPDKATVTITIYNIRTKTL